MKLAEKRVVSGSDLSPGGPVDGGSDGRAKEYKHKDDDEKGDGDEDEDEEVVDGLIERMQRNMRIVSSTSTTMAARPRMSEVEADEVDGTLGEVPEETVGTDEEAGSHQEGPRKKDMDGGLATPSTKVRHVLVEGESDTS
jgi:hypothetical protein